MTNKILKSIVIMETGEEEQRSENEGSIRKRGRRREPDLKGIVQNRLEYIKLLMEGYLSGDFDRTGNGSMAPFARFPH